MISSRLRRSSRLAAWAGPGGACWKNYRNRAACGRGARRYREWPSLCMFPHCRRLGLPSSGKPRKGCIMRIRVGSELSFDFPQITPMIAMLSVHFSRFSDLERPDHLKTSPSVPIDGYRDSFGNWCTRLVAPAGRFSLGTDAILRDPGVPDPADLSALQHQVQHLPTETLLYLLGSRYCETDRLSEEAWRLFAQTPLGWPRVQAVCDFVHGHVKFGYEHSRATRTAFEAYTERLGVCRDYAHLAIAFCRCLNMPARYCAGYITDIDLPPPYEPMDFSAW